MLHELSTDTAHFFPFGATTLFVPRPPHCRGFEITRHPR